MKPRLFFILGRPRSRTAWLANLFTAPLFSYCFHEGLADVGASTFLLGERMAEVPLSAVGNADTGMIHQADELVDAFPDARFVLVTGTSARRAWHSFASHHRVPELFVEKVDDDFAEAGKLLSDHPNALFIDREELDLPRKMRALWEHCLGTADGWSPQRLELLRGLNVTADDAMLAQRIRQGLGKV